MAKSKVTSLRAQWLGERLRKHRIAAGFTLKQVAEHLQLTQGTLSHFEGGTYRIRRVYVNELINLYGVHTRRERDALAHLNEDAWRKDWWDGDTDDLDMGFVDYTWLEARAAQINAYESTLINGLLQTTDYTQALAVAGLGPDTPAETIDRMVEVRLARQRIINREEPTRLHCVMEENALRRPIGGPATLKAQLKHVLSMMDAPHVTVQVLLPEVGWHGSLQGPFIFFDMPDPYPDVVYLESLLSRTFLEDEGKVRRYQQTYDELRSAALSSTKSAKLITNVIKELR